MDHKAYRSTEYWFNLRHKMFIERGGRCEKCGKVLHGDNYDIHHIDGTYREFDEIPSNLMLICRDCHKTYHEQGDFHIPKGIHDFTVLSIEEKPSHDGTKQGYQLIVAVTRQIDKKECKCWKWIEKNTDHELYFRMSVGLPEHINIYTAIGRHGRAMFSQNERGFNQVDRFFAEPKYITDNRRNY